MRPRNIATLIWFFAFTCVVLAHSFLGLGSIFVWVALAIYAIILTAVLLFVLVKTKQLTVLYPVASIVFAVILCLVF